MPFECKNKWTGECGTSRGCYCFCMNDKKGDCDEKCFCNIVPDTDLQDLANQMKSAMNDVSQSVRQVGLKIVECIGNYDMFYDDENMADSDVSVVHHTDIYTDAIYIHPYNSGGYQTSTGIYVETIIDHLPPEIIIEIREWGEI